MQLAGVEIRLHDAEPEIAIAAGREQVEQRERAVRDGNGSAGEFGKGRVKALVEGRPPIDMYVTRAQFLTPDRGGANQHQTLLGQ